MNEKQQISYNFLEKVYMKISKELRKNFKYRIENGPCLPNRTDYSADEKQYIKNADIITYGGGLTAYFKPSEDTTAHYLYLDCLFQHLTYCGSHVKREGLENYEMCFTIGGSAQLTYEGQKISQRPGSVYIIDCRKPHETEVTGNNWEVIGLHFNGPSARILFDKICNLPGYPLLYANTQAGALSNYINEIFTVVNEPEDLRPLLAHRILTDILCHIIYKSTFEKTNNVQIKEDMLEVLNYLKSHYSDDITLDKLSEQFFLNKYHLSRKFKESTGFSPIEYLQKIRIGIAKDMLRNSDLSITEISRMVGFHSDSQFRYLFHKYAEGTPQSFRNAVL